MKPRGSMEKLWAPWRHAYVSAAAQPACIFCRNGKSRRDSRSYIFARSRHACAMLNIFPYNNGHCMVAPYRHVRSLHLLSDGELLDLMRLVNRVQRLLEKTLRPQGFNIGVNIGAVGGAGFAGHVHVHIVPRWKGDTNFMPVTAGTKVISASLKAMYALLKE